MRTPRPASILLLLLLCLAALAQPANYRIMNKGREGQTFAITEYLTRGKMNLVEFTSEACPACRALNPKLSAMSAKMPDLVLNQLVVDRPGSQGIDWQSPLARQYELRSVPYFKIYDPAGVLVAEGEPARKMVAKMLLESKVL